MKEDAWRGGLLLRAAPLHSAMEDCDVVRLGEWVNIYDSDDNGRLRFAGKALVEAVLDKRLRCRVRFEDGRVAEHVVDPGGQFTDPDFYCRIFNEVML